MKEKTFELGDMVMVRNHLEHNGEIGIVVQTYIQQETNYRNQYKVYFKNCIQWFHNFELEHVES